MINIRILPEEGVKDQDFKDAFVISIVSPGREHPKIVGSNIYKFHFHDVGQTYELPDGRLIDPISETIAESIAEIAMHHRHCNWWVVHCEAGISRSPGVAIGLSRFITFNPGRQQLKKMYPLYNKYVCKLVEDAMNCKMENLIKELNIKSGYKDGVIEV